VINKDERRDVALLRANRPLPAKPLPLATYRPASGSDIKAIGFAVTADYQLTQLTKKWSAMSDQDREKALVNELNKYELHIASKFDGKVGRVIDTEGVILVQHQITIDKGNSGSPLFDGCAHVVGVNRISEPGMVSSSLCSNCLFGILDGWGFGKRVDTRQSCNMVNYQHYMPYAGVSLAILLSLIAVVIAFRRAPVVQRPYTAMTRMLGANTEGSAPLTASPPPTRSAPPWASDGTVMPSTRSAPPEAPAGKVLRLVSESGGSDVVLAYDCIEADGGAILGRDQKCDVVIRDDTVSKRHARLFLGRDGSVLVEDLSSGNGTWKGKRRVGREALANGDTIRFGNAEFRIELPRRAGERAEASLLGQERSALAPSPQGGADRRANERSWVLSGFDEAGRVIQISLRPIANGGETKWTIGRKAGRVDFVVPHNTISSEHACVRYTPGKGIEICDLDSSNGTRVDGKRVGRDYVPLDNARKIVLGEFEMTLSRS
jgi:pSer/pThr/pTyr-binding forkhead associated (FHA) protein